VGSPRCFDDGNHQTQSPKEDDLLEVRVAARLVC
jgi:hypothetical protein